MNNHLAKPEIVIVGGGAAGLELAAMLSRKLVKQGKTNLTLIDANLKHVWKPLLHEVATGTLSSYEEQLDYIPYANRMGFHFAYGKLEAIDRSNKNITISAITDEAGAIIVPQRRISYGILVIAIGSLSNDFSVPGVREHCLFLDSLDQAEHVQKILLGHIIQKIQTTFHKSKPLNIAIVGAGATGVELAAEIQYAIQQSQSYEQKIPFNKNYSIKLIESRDRIVSQLPERVSTALTRYLVKLGIEVHVNEHVSEVTKDKIKTKNGDTIPANIKIWAAGIKCDDILNRLDLETNRLNQLLVNNYLQTTMDEAIFAIGDCASLEGVPPTAQASHQQALTLVKSITNKINNRPLIKFTYTNYGAVISVSHYNFVANLMGKFNSRIFLQGRLARLLYFIIQKKHQIALHGYWSVILLWLANWLTRQSRSRLKLH